MTRESKPAPAVSPQYKDRAEQIVTAACKDAAAKLQSKHDHVSSLWAEAHSIPAGCGCTPFYSDARAAEALFSKEVIKFERKYGKEALKKLRLFYGVPR